MKYFLIVISLMVCHRSMSQVLLDADGSGDTYALITSVLAPNENPIEAPDCSHEDFGEHIDQVFDVELNDFAFQFYIHTSPDDDRCINFDRQRNEIKSYDKSPNNLKGIEGEVVVYKWKFRLPEGFQSSPNFTHLHQLKSVGGPLDAMPMYTLTTRKGTPDRLELRYAETDQQITLKQSDLAPFINTWLEVTETISYGSDGSYEITIDKIEDNSNLFSYTNNSIVNWRTEAEFVRPKWGIYRSLQNEADLRDETVFFANFSVEETISLSVTESQSVTENLIVFHSAEEKLLHFVDCPDEVAVIRIRSISGREILQQKVDNRADFQISTAALGQGIYVVSFDGERTRHSKLIVLTN